MDYGYCIYLRMSNRIRIRTARCPLPAVAHHSAVSKREGLQQGIICMQCPHAV